MVVRRGVEVELGVGHRACRRRSRRAPAGGCRFPCGRRRRRDRRARSAARRASGSGPLQPAPCGDRSGRRSARAGAPAGPRRSPGRAAYAASIWPVSAAASCQIDVHPQQRLTGLGEDLGQPGGVGGVACRRSRRAGRRSPRTRSPRARLGSIPVPAVARSISGRKRGHPRRGRHRPAGALGEQHVRAPGHGARACEVGLARGDVRERIARPRRDGRSRAAAARGGRRRHPAARRRAAVTRITAARTTIGRAGVGARSLRLGLREQLHRPATRGHPRPVAGESPVLRNEHSDAEREGISLKSGEPGNLMEPSASYRWPGRLFSCASGPAIGASGPNHGRARPL